MSGKPIFDEAGRFIGYRGVAHDITDHKSTEARLQAQSAFDALTGIANRRRFDEFLEHEWHSAGRTGAPLALILVDVDHFKAFNDHYGHGAGDECLSAVGAVLERGLRRKIDLAARYGGEEFACVLPGTDVPGACAVAERLRRDVERLQVPHEHSPTAPCVTISLGVAAARAGAQSGTAELLASADERLYGAKHAGRNRVCGQTPERNVVPIDRTST